MSENICEYIYVIINSIKKSQCSIMVVEDLSTFDLKIITKNLNNAYIILISFKIDINNILSYL